MIVCKATSLLIFLFVILHITFLKQKQELLTAVSGTENGKKATPEQQAKVLQIV